MKQTYIVITTYTNFWSQKIDIDNFKKSTTEMTENIIEIKKKSQNHNKQSILASVMNEWAETNYQSYLQTGIGSWLVVWIC